ncbi:MAG: adenylate/guanylate cyclase domain-containing protein, partial [Candidatus Limnocylindrales bacterium]
MAIERRIVTVLFADLVGFTALSERLDPEDVASVQDAYFATVRDTIARHGGTLEKFIGDAAMAVFGLTRARDDDAERAVRAGFALTNAVEALGGRLGLESAELRLRVGINTGEVVTAEGGPDRGRVTGDTVNAAARLQTAAPPGRVLVGETTALAVADSVELEAVSPLVLKGKAEPVRASLAVAMRAERSREEATGGLRARMLGRDAEIAELGRFAQRLIEGATEQVLLVAPPGVGKTRLTDEFVMGLGGVRTLRARLRPDTSSPYDGISQLMRTAVGTVAVQERPAWIAVRLEAAGVSAARAATMAADAESLLAEPGAVVASADRLALFDAWMSALDASDDRPTLWLIEDVHWAGPDLLAFLAAARARPRHAGRLVLATARPSLLERLGPDPGWTTIHLEALQAIDAGALVRALVGDALPDELVERIVQRSDGNCLFIEELLRTWIAAGTLIRGEVAGTWTLAVTVDDAPLPTSVQQIYAGQLDDLPPSARNAARLASVAGRRFPSDALATLGVRDGPDALAMLDRRALISGPTTAPITGDSYAYRHALLHEAAYASLARAERARSHVALARWLEAAAGNRVAELSDAIASHYESAVRSVPALASDVADGLSR